MKFNQFVMLVLGLASITAHAQEHGQSQSNQSEAQGPARGSEFEALRLSQLGEGAELNFPERVIIPAYLEHLTFQNGRILGANERTDKGQPYCVFEFKRSDKIREIAAGTVLKSVRPLKDLGLEFKGLQDLSWLDCEAANREAQVQEARKALGKFNLDLRNLKTPQARDLKQKTPLRKRDEA
jgi:hypothetical protein